MLQTVTIEELTSARLVIERAVVENLFQKVDASDIACLQENISQARCKIAVNSTCL
jgi:DNA-binding GntR family transcriptional regulator